MELITPKRVRYFNDQDWANLKFAFNAIKPRNENDWKAVAQMVGPKFSVNDIKAKCEKMQLKADTRSPQTQLVLEKLKKVKDTIGGKKRRGIKSMEHVRAMDDLIALTYQEPTKKTKTVKQEMSEDDDGEDQFIHDAFTSPLTKPVDLSMYELSKFKINRRQWTPTALKTTVEDVGDDFNTPSRFDTKYRDAYILNQIKSTVPKKRKKQV